MPEVRSDEPRRVELLYITYDGLLEAVGRSQVVAYLKGVAESGLPSVILSFEKPKDLANEAGCAALRMELESVGILWKPLTYHRRPSVPATVWDLSRGIVAALGLFRRYGFRAIHARSCVAGLIGLVVSTLTGSRLVFDMRGFWPEERVELGIFRQNGFLYRLSKLAERTILGASDHVVVLTESAKAILRDREAAAELRSHGSRGTPITVIPCCVDLEKYRPRTKDIELARIHGLDAALVLGNIGAFNRRYMTAEMFRFAFHVKSHRPDMRFVYLTQQDEGGVQKAGRDAGLMDEDLLVLRVASSEVPRWLSLFRLGVFFLRPSYAAKGSSFTKLGEFLAAGVPVVTNTGVGDVDRILASNRCGLLLPGLTDRDLSVFARKALPLLEGSHVPAEVGRHCRVTAQEHFALEEGVRRYRSIYDSLAATTSESDEVRVAAELG
jgi:glycosyltransferase involved in cell wall biosynthesis